MRLPIEGRRQFQGVLQVGSAGRWVLEWSDAPPPPTRGNRGTARVKAAAGLVKVAKAAKAVKDAGDGQDGKDATEATEVKAEVSLETMAEAFTTPPKTDAPNECPKPRRERVDAKDLDQTFKKLRFTDEPEDGEINE